MHFSSQLLPFGPGVYLELPQEQVKDEPWETHLFPACLTTQGSDPTGHVNAGDGAEIVGEGTDAAEVVAGDGANPGPTLGVPPAPGKIHPWFPNVA